MDTKIKIIKLQTDNLDKTNLYKDILSSSDKIKAIIKKTKANRNKYRQEKPSKSKLELNCISKNPVKHNHTIKEHSINKAQLTNVEPPINKKVNSSAIFVPNIKEEPSKKEYKKTKQNKTTFFKYEPKPNYIKSKKKRELCIKRVYQMESFLEHLLSPMASEDCLAFLK